MSQILQNPDVIGRLQLVEATPAQIANFVNGDIFRSTGIDRPEIMVDGSADEVAVLGDLAQFMTAGSITSAIDAAVETVDGAMRFRDLFDPSTGALPTPQEDGDLFVSTGAGSVTIPIGTIVRAKAANVTGTYTTNPDGTFTFTTAGTLAFTDGDQLVKIENDGGADKWGHIDVPFFGTLASTTQAGLVKLTDVTAITNGDPATGIENTTVTYEGLLAMKTLIDAGYTNAIAAQEVLAAAERIVTTKQFAEGLANAIDTNGNWNVTIPANASLAQLADVVYQAMDQTYDQIATYTDAAVENRIKQFDGRHRINYVLAPTYTVDGLSADTFNAVLNNGAIDITHNSTISIGVSNFVALFDENDNFITYANVLSTADGTSTFSIISGFGVAFDQATFDLFTNGNVKVKTATAATAYEKASEVAQIDGHLRQDLTGQETDAAPSVAAVDAAINNVIANSVNGNFVALASAQKQTVNSDIGVGGTDVRDVLVTNVNPGALGGDLFVMDAADLTNAQLAIGDTVTVQGNYLGNPVSSTGEILLVAPNGIVLINTSHTFAGTFVDYSDWQINDVTYVSVNNLSVEGTLTVNDLPQDLTGDEIDQAPSVAAVKQAIDDLDTNISGNFVSRVSATEQVIESDISIGSTGIVSANAVGMTNGSGSGFVQFQFMPGNNPFSIGDTVSFEVGGVTYSGDVTDDFNTATLLRTDIPWTFGTGSLSNVIVSSMLNAATPNDFTVVGDTELKGTLKVDSLPQNLDGNESDQAPSVGAVKTEVDAINTTTTSLQTQIDAITGNQAGDMLENVFALGDAVVNGDNNEWTYTMPSGYRASMVTFEIDGNPAQLQPTFNAGRTTVMVALPTAYSLTELRFHINPLAV